MQQILGNGGDHAWLHELADLYLMAATGGADGEPEMFQVLALSERLDQLRSLHTPQGEMVGFIAWLRTIPAHLHYFEQKDFPGVCRLSPVELTTGPVCCVTEMLALKPRIAYHAVRALSRMDGVRWMAAWRKGRFRVRRV